MRTSLVLVATLLLLAVVPVRADDAPKGGSIALEAYGSAHYRLQTDIDAATAREYLRVIETAWPQLEEFFGAEPRLKKGDRLDVCYLATQQEWQTRMQDDGVTVPSGAGGYYWPGNKTVYLWKQPTLYNSRQLLLHECMHQFHYLSRCGNVSPKDTWYVEGIVESLSRHYWDGDKLTLGVIPFCSLANYSKAALERMQASDYDLAGMIDGDRASQRQEQWALTRWLLEEGGDRQWQILRKKLDGGQTARKVFRRLYGDPAKLLPKIVEWLRTKQEPFVPVWNEWQGQGAHAVIGTSNVTSACRAREDATELSATLHVPRGNWKGGLLVGFTDANSYAVALLNSEGGFSINQRVGDNWKVLERGAAPPAEDGLYRLKAARDGGKITLTANDTELGRFELEGHKLGVCLDNCTLRFTDIVWK